MYSLCIGAMLLTGCATSPEPVPPCCYRGEYSMARLAEVRLALADGRTLRFAELFPGFTPDTGLLSPLLPFREVALGDVDYERAATVLAAYDANADGLIEEPELARLVVQEAARGLGLRVEHLEASPRVQALVLSAADTGGLMRWVERMQPKMSPDARALFGDLDRIGQDLRLKGSEGEGSQGDSADFDL